ncbi:MULTISPECIES: hypothetical protein [unclassified Mesotoga]|uniref:hypothetical protein n=1 Tax=unclassified Mesotoga TaxID=1184398 RepID=UPI000DA6970A|nr:MULTISPECIES: hypothetical protein [unclassified Mesotoga]PZC52299.1 hypothetical protein LH53_05645 [Mesotoga sp. TolDC]
MDENKEGCPPDCNFEKNKQMFEESILKKVKQMLRLEYDSLFSQFDDYKMEQAKAIESFKKIQDETLKEFREELITYFRDKFEPNFTQAIFEMNKSLVEKVINGNYDLKKMQMEEATKKEALSTSVKTKRLEMWQFVLVAIFGAFGVKVIEFIAGLFK